MYLDMVVSCISIILFGCMVVNYVVIRPLQCSMALLWCSVTELKAILEKTREEMYNETRLFDSRLVLVEASIKLAHRRIDKLVKGAE